MKKLFISISLLGLLMFAGQASATQTVAANSTTISFASYTCIPMPMVLKVLRAAVPPMRQEMQGNFTIGHAIGAYVRGYLTITEVGHNTYRVVYGDCVVIVTVDDI